MEWKEVKLGDIATMKYGKLPPKETGNIPIHSGYRVVGFCNHKNCDANTIVVVARGVGGCGDVKLLKEDCFLTNLSISVNWNSDVCNPVYFYYLHLKNNLAHLNSGSAQPQITVDSLQKYSFSIPDRETQDKIVDILSSLDRKIELNNKINAQLEEMAQTLFKHWFVDFGPFKDGKFVESELGLIPEGWNIVSLDDLTSKFGTGLNPRKNFVLGKGENYYVTIKNLSDNRVYLDEKCDRVNDEALALINKRSKLMKGDLLFSGVATVGRVALVVDEPKNWHTGETIFNMHPQGVSSEFLYILLLSKLFQEYVKVNLYGSSQQCISMASLKAYKIALPNNDVLKEFDSIIIPIIRKIKSIDKENDSLAKSRDTLLPKLMSGEINLEDYGGE